MYLDYRNAIVLAFVLVMFLNILRDVERALRIELGTQVEEAGHWSRIRLLGPCWRDQSIGAVFVRVDLGDDLRVRPGLLEPRFLLLRGLD